MLRRESRTVERAANVVAYLMEHVMLGLWVTAHTVKVANRCFDQSRRVPTVFVVHPAKSLREVLKFSNREHCFFQCRTRRRVFLALNAAHDHRDALAGRGRYDERQVGPDIDRHRGRR